MATFFTSAPPRRQVGIILVAALLLCGLLAIAYFAWFRTSYAPLFSDLREADAATIVAELDKGKVDYRLADGGTTILVPEGLVDATRLEVMGQDLPLRGAVGLELFDNSSIGLTEFAQRINFQRALQGELARTIMSIDAVESARVHLTLGEQTIFRGDRRPPRASVAVTTRPGRRLSVAAVRGIQRLVAGSVPDLDAGGVVVINDRGAVVSGEALGEVPALPGMAERQSVERFYEARIRRELETRYPADAIEVSVWATGADPAFAGVSTAAAERDYRLRVNVRIAVPLGVAARREIGELVGALIGRDAASGDVVEVSPSAPQGEARDWSEAISPPARAPRPLGSGPSGWLWGLAALVGAILLLLVRRGAAPVPLTEAQRLRYVARLRSALNEGDPGVVPPA